MKLLKFIIVFLLITSCAPIYVTYDYDKQKDFSTYKTYNYFSNVETGMSDLDTKRFLDALDVAMQIKGFKLSETPDILIDVKSNEYQEAQRNSVGVGVGGGGRNVGGGLSVGIPLGQNNIKRQITIDFVESKQLHLVWQAKSESTYNQNATPEKREAQFKAILEKVFKKYPPSTNK